MRPKRVVRGLQGARGGSGKGSRRTARSHWREGLAVSANLPDWHALAECLAELCHPANVLKILRFTGAVADKMVDKLADGR
jgi:hypothetical protein